MSRKIDKELLDKIDSLDERASEFRSKYDKEQEKYEGIPVEDDTPEVRLGRKAGSMFLGNVIAGLIAGLLIDKYFDTAPWGLMLCIIMGFVAGVYRAQDVLKKNE